MNYKLIIIQWIANWWYPNIYNSKDIISYFFNRMELWSRTKGDLWLISHIKEIRLLYTRYLCGVPVKSSSHIIGIRKDGLPKGLVQLNKLIISGKPEEISFVLTLLSVSRCIDAWKPVSYETITKESEIKMDLTDLSIFMNRFLYDHKLSAFNVSWSRNDSHYSIKAGPSGIATFTSVVDSMKLPKTIKNALYSISKEIGNEASLWSSVMSEIKPNKLKTMFKAKLENYSRKLSIVKDPEGKSRVIAIVDYWTQSILLQIHNELFSYLKRLPQDRTFTQNPIVDFVGPYHSLDLSAATDRFPLEVQKLLMAKLIGTEKSEAWANLLVSEPYRTPEGDLIYYKAGQPMGAYSSWACFTLCHHIIVQYCAYLIGEYPTKSYILLGDDIVIGGDKLAHKYREVMTLLGVEISDHKSHTSLNMYEFAKRWFKDGVEVSGIQLSAFLETRKHYHLLYATIKSYYERGIVPRRFTTIPDLIESLMITSGMYSKKARNIRARALELDALYCWVHGEDSGAIKLRNLIITKSSQDAVIPKDYYLSFDIYSMARLRTVLLKMFHSLQDNIMSYHDDINEKLNAKFNPSDRSYDDDYEINWEALADQADMPLRDSLSFSEVNSLPINYALHNQWKKLSEDERIMEENYDIKDAIKALSIPSIDRLGERRVSVRILNTTAKTASKFKESLRLFERAWMFEQQHLFNFSSINEIIR
jgi:hypothetical protein